MRGIGDVLMVFAAIILFAGLVFATGDGDLSFSMFLIALGFWMFFIGILLHGFGHVADEVRRLREFLSEPNGSLYED